MFKKILLNSIKESYITFVRYNPIVSYEVLTAVLLKVHFFQDVTICHRVRSTRHFEVSYLDSPFQTLGTNYPMTCYNIPQEHILHHFTASYQHHIHNCNQFKKNIIYTGGRYVDNLTTCKLYIPSLMCSGIYNQ